MKKIKLDFIFSIEQLYLLINSDHKITEYVEAICISYYENYLGQNNCWLFGHRGSTSSGKVKYTANFMQFFGLQNQFSYAQRWESIWICDVASSFSYVASAQALIAKAAVAAAVAAAAMVAAVAAGLVVAKPVDVTVFFANAYDS